MPDGSRREQPARSGDEGEFEFDVQLLQVALLLGGFPRLHHPAKVAGVVAIESFLERRGETIRLRKAHGHADPRGGLQKEPMPAGSHNQCEHDEPFAAADEHPRIVAKSELMSTHCNQLCAVASRPRVAGASARRTGRGGVGEDAGRAVSSASA